MAHTATRNHVCESSELMATLACGKGKDMVSVAREQPTARHKLTDQRAFECFGSVAALVVAVCECLDGVHMAMLGHLPCLLVRLIGVQHLTQQAPV